MRDFLGETLKSGGPSTPLDIIGFDELPVAGEFCRVVKDERLARSLAHRRANRLKTEALAKERALTLDDVFARIAAGKVLDLNLVVKADVQGSLEALSDALLKIQHPEVKVRVIHSGVGGINENDIMLASASAAIIIGFNVRPSPAATSLAETEGVDVRTYRVIYKVTEDITAALVGMLKPTIEEVVLGQAEVRTTFKASKLGTIAGCMVTHGVITRNASVRVLRSDVVVHDGKMGSLKRFAEDAREVAEGFECGILVDGYNDLKEGDVLEAFETREVAREA
jgi:translation initiation factor IF-2